LIFFAFADGCLAGDISLIAAIFLLRLVCHFAIFIGFVGIFRYCHCHAAIHIAICLRACRHISHELAFARSPLLDAMPYYAHFFRLYFASDYHADISFRLLYYHRHFRSFIARWLLIFSSPPSLHASPYR